jgi:hypothetical protein
MSSKKNGNLPVNFIKFQSKSKKYLKFFKITKLTKNSKVEAKRVFNEGV